MPFFPPWHLPLSVPVRSFSWLNVVPSNSRVNLAARADVNGENQSDALDSFDYYKSAPVIKATNGGLKNQKTRQTRARMWENEKEKGTQTGTKQWERRI